MALLNTLPGLKAVLSSTGPSHILVQIITVPMPMQFDNVIPILTRSHCSLVQ